VLIISFDMNTDDPRSGKARKAFEDTLEARGWKTEIRVGDTLETLPATTRVADRTAAEAKLDLLAADAAATRIEPLFAVTKHVISQFARIDSGSDDVRPAGAIQDLIERTRR